MRKVHRVHVASTDHRDDQVFLTINGASVIITLRAPASARVYALDVMYDEAPRFDPLGQDGA